MPAQTSSSLTATGSVTLSSKPLSDNMLIAVVSGTYGTVSFVFEGSADGGTNWFGIAAQRYDTSALVNGTISPSNDAEQAWAVPCAGLTAVRLRCTAIASGTLAVDLRSDCFTLPPIIAVNFTGSTITSLLTVSGGIDFPDNALISFGDSDDVTARWDNTDFDILALADDTILKIGNGTNSFDLWLYGNAASTYVSWDASADSMKFEDNCFLGFGTNTAGPGTKGDINITWNGTKLLVAQTTANSAIDWGVDGAGIDMVFYGDTASTNMTWDQSADSLIFTGATRVLWTGTTGQPEMHLTDNLADAMSIKIPSGNDLMFFTTTDSAEKVTIPAAFVQGSDATDRVTIKGIYMSPANVSVTIPTFAADTCDSVAVSVASAFSMQPAVGDAVIAMPQEALPTNCVLTNAYVTGTDEITVTFASAEAGGVTGAAKNFKFLVIDLT